MKTKLEHECQLYSAIYHSSLITRVISCSDNQLHNRSNSTNSASTQIYNRNRYICRSFSVRSNNLTNTNTSTVLNPSADGLRSHGGENIVRKREARITKASIAITLMFVICHTPRIIPNVMEVALEQDAFPKVSYYDSFVLTFFKTHYLLHGFFVNFMANRLLKINNF